MNKHQSMHPFFQKFTESVKGLLYKDPFEKDLKMTLAASLAKPDDLRIKIRLGEIYFKKRDIPSGIAIFRQVGDTYTQEEFVLKAIAIYKKIIQMSPGSVEFNEKLAELYLKLGMQKDAINQYLIVINYYQNHGEREKALEVARKMVAVDPKDIQNRMRLAEIYYNQGLQEEALKEYEEIGTQLKGQEGKQLGLLIDVLEKIYFRRPKDKNLLRELCMLYLKNHEPQPVLRRIERLKLLEEEEFKKFYDQAKIMLEEDVKKKEEKERAELIEKNKSKPRP